MKCTFPILYIYIYIYIPVALNDILLKKINFWFGLVYAMFRMCNEFSTL